MATSWTTKYGLTTNPPNALPTHFTSTRHPYPPRFYPSPEPPHFHSTPRATSPSHYTPWHMRFWYVQPPFHQQDRVSHAFIAKTGPTTRSLQPLFHYQYEARHPFINTTGSATLSRRGQPNFYCSHRHYQDERFHGSHLQCQDEVSHPFIDKLWCDFDMHHRHMGFLSTAGTWDFDKHSRRVYNYQHMMDIIHNDSWHSSHTHMPLKAQFVLIGGVYPFSHSFGTATFTGGPFYFLMWRRWMLTCIFLNVLKYIWVR